MWIPKNYQENDPEALLAFMRSHPFAVMVTGEKLLGTHLPFVVSVEENRIVLTSHIALENPQSAWITGQQVLVIFSGPNAYIAPSLYKNKVQVPTWDYVAVHAYGNVTPLEGHEAQMQVMEKTFQTFGPEYMEQWQTLPHKYRDELLKYIVAFEIEVTDLQGQFKLSQNKSVEDRERIVKWLEQGDSYAQETAEYMAGLGFSGSTD